MFVSSVCCVGDGVCDELITDSGEFYRVCVVCVYVVCMCVCGVCMCVCVCGV